MRGGSMGVESIGKSTSNPQIQEISEISEISYDVKCIPCIDYTIHTEIRIENNKIRIDKHEYSKISVGKYESAEIDKMDLTKIYTKYKPINLGFGINTLLVLVALVVVLNTTLFILDTVSEILITGFSLWAILKILLVFMAIASIIRLVLKKIHNKPEPNHYVLRYNKKGRDLEIYLPMGVKVGSIIEQIKEGIGEV